MSRAIRLLFDSFADEPAVDTAVSRAILLGIDEGTQPETLRIHRPGNVVAFGRQDAVSAGYQAAVAAARLHGFDPVERLAGGRAAVFTSDTIAFSWARPDPAPKQGISERFQELAAIMVGALRALGVPAGVGETPGEYCPGAYSVHDGAGRKLVGTGQRLTRRAAHVGGVVVVDGRDRVNGVLLPVYRALDLAWDPEATGDIARSRPAVTWEEVVDAIVDQFRSRFSLIGGSIDQATLDRARELAGDHIPDVGRARSE